MKPVLVLGTALCCSAKMMSDFEWSDARVFLAVLRSGSTLAAGRSLGIAQPTVARRIEALEHALKLTLFERDTRGFHPTPAADMLRPAAEAMERAAETLIGSAAAARSVGLKPIRITAPPQSFSPGLVTILENFEVQHPGVRFEYVSSNRLLDLVAGEADVAIRICDKIDDQRLVCRKLSEAKASLYGARKYAEAHGLPPSLEQLTGHRVVVMDHAAHTVRLNRWLIDNCAPGQIVARSADLEGLVASARSGIGLAAIPVSIAADYADLVQCFPPSDEPGMPVWLVFSPRAWARPEVKSFAAYFAPRWIAHIRGVKSSAPR